MEMKEKKFDAKVFLMFAGTIFVFSYLAVSLHDYLKTKKGQKQ